MGSHVPGFITLPRLNVCNYVSLSVLSKIATVKMLNSIDGDQSMINIRRGRLTDPTKMAA